jgi:hypothetical protein
MKISSEDKVTIAKTQKVFDNFMKSFKEIVSIRDRVSEIIIRKIECKQKEDRN